MSSTTLSTPAPEVTTQHLISLNSVVKHIQDGVSFVKDEIRDMYDMAGTCINKMVLPVNNFLKDPLHIESELQLEFTKECICNGVDHHGHLYMEENY